MRASDPLAAAAVAGTLSGLPSTLFNLLAGRPLLEAAQAAGNVVLPPETEPAKLLVAGALAHGALSLGWATVTLPLVARSRHPAMAGAAVGLGIAAVDLGLVARLLAPRRMALIRALPVWPQVADHLAFGALVGLTVSRRGRGRDTRDNSQRSPTPPSFAVWRRSR